MSVNAVRSSERECMPMRSSSTSIESHKSLFCPRTSHMLPCWPIGRVRGQRGRCKTKKDSRVSGGIPANGADHVGICGNHPQRLCLCQSVPLSCFHLLLLSPKYTACRGLLLIPSSYCLFNHARSRNVICREEQQRKATSC